MKILHDSTIFNSLSNSILFIDTNAFIGIFNYQRIFLNLVKKLKDNNCEFLTISSVFFEFTRGSSDINTFNKRSSFIKSNAGIISTEKLLGNIESLTIVLQKVKGDMSYTDFLLCACLYKFPNSFVITEDHQHFPTNILDREFIITIDTEKQIRNYGIYKFSMDKFNKAAEKILMISNPSLKQ